MTTAIGQQRAEATAEMAHLLRRAGFGATRAELEAYLDKGYEGAVEALLDPADVTSMPDDLIRRYHVDQAEARLLDSAASKWMYRLVTTSAPLQEKMALFWHGLFATSAAKVFQEQSALSQIDMFRRLGMDDFRTLLVELSRDPAMIFWLDNQDNHSHAINENYGRELLELFSMGVGNYTEDDIKECARAFTGWTIENAEYMVLRSNSASIWPYSKIAWQFRYDDDDHDHGVKTFLGETGNFNGEDIVEIIARQPATARFVAWRLYQFFVSQEVGADGERLIEQLAQSYFDSGYEIRAMLRTLFLSDHFRSEAVRFVQIKSPAELVIGTLRLARALEWPALDVRDATLSASYMGQHLLGPPSVEGWHEGDEWVDSGALVERVNFAAKYLGDVQQAGVRDIVDSLAALDGGVLSPEQAVDGCLDLLGPVAADADTRRALVAHVAEEGDVDLRGERSSDSARRVAELLGLIASTREYQLA